MMLRKKRVVTEELANHLYLSRQAVSKWESGQSMPDTDKIIQQPTLSCNIRLSIIRSGK